MLESINSTQSAIMLWLGIAVMLLGLGAAAFKSGRLIQVLGALCLADIGYVFVGLGAGTDAGLAGAALQLAYTGGARLLAFLCLIRLCREAAAAFPAENGLAPSLDGIGRALPLTSTLYALGMFAALGVSPCLTPDAKPYILYAVLNAHGWLAAGLVVLGNAMMAVLTLLSVHNLWLGSGKYEERLGGLYANYSTASVAALFPLLLLAVILAGMGVFGHQLTAALAGPLGVSLAALPDMAVRWDMPVLVIFGAAFAAYLLGQFSTILRNAVAGLALAAAFALVLLDANLAPLGRLFAIITTGIGLAVAVYSWSYMHGSRRNGYYFMLLIMFGSLTGIALAQSLGAFFVFWELMTFSSYVLVAWEATPKAHYAAKKYFLMCSVAAALMLPGLLLLAVYGGSLDIAGLAGLVAQGTGVIPGMVVVAVTILVLVGCGVKAGLFPGHSWLPDAHPAAPSSISAPLSGVLTKAGIFGIVQVFLVVFGVGTLSSSPADQVYGVPVLGWVVCFFGMATLLYGEFMALMEQDLKRLLAYSTMGQIGEITMTLGLFTWLAATGSLLHVFNHAVMKDLLFLCSGALILRAGSRKLTDLRGLGKAMPVTAACMVVGLIAILGLPPFAGFTSKYLMIYSLASVSPLLAALMLLASLAGVIYYTRIIRTLIFEPYTGPKIQDAPLAMLLPIGALAVLCVVLGLFPQIGLGLVLPVVSALAGGGKIAAQNLPLLTASWPIYSIVLMAGAILPFLLRRNRRLAGQATALVLAAAAVLVGLDWQSFDMLSLIFALIVTVIGCVNTVYAVGYMDHSHTQWRFYAFFLFMCSGLTGVAASRDLFNFFLFWEIMSSWSLYFVIVHEENAAALREGFKYFFFNVLGAAFLFLAVALVANWVGSAAFETVAEQFPRLENWKIFTGIALFTIGFLMKAAQLPFRIDIQMHPATAPTPVSGYISSVLLKSAIYGLAKLFLSLGGGAIFASGFSAFGQAEIMHVAVWIGGITIVMAAAFAVMQKDIKLVLIYSTVSQLGYMVVGVSLGTSLGVAGGLLHLVNHVFFKDLLFLVAGAIIVRAHRQSLDDMGGLGSKMPVTMFFFAIGALCVIGVPPSSGFTSKWIIYHALMAEGFVFVAILSLVGSVLTMAYFAKVLHLAFFGLPAPGLENVTEAPKTMLIPMGILTAGCLVSSIVPGVILLPLNEVLAQFGLAPLHVAPWGIASGTGAWNATLTFVLVAVAWIGGRFALRRLSGPRRMTEIHTCGIPPSELNVHTSTLDIYSAPVSLLPKFGLRRKPKANYDLPGAD